MTTSEFWADVGRRTRLGIQRVKFLPTTDNFIALTDLPAIWFEEYAPDPDRQYVRGHVLKMPGDNISKYLSEHDGVRIQASRPPGHPDNRDFKLFRNGGRYRHVRGEFVRKGWWRWWDSDPGRQQQHGWYEMLSEHNDENHDPPNVPHIWAFKGSQDPPA